MTVAVDLRIIDLERGSDMNTNAELADTITTSLKLATSPVAISFWDEVPAEVAPFAGTAPAGCSFWEQGMTRSFATAASDHALCSIGVHTHRLANAPPTQAQELQDTLGAMAGLDYVREAEVQAIPTMAREHRHVVYGPLHEHPAEPQVVLLFCDGRQGLVLAEATQRVDGDVPHAMGRPACALVPQVISQGAAANSLGCCGARAYLDVLSDQIALWGLPGAKLSAYASELEILDKANDVLTTFHERRAKDIAGGARPTVRESLDRLSS